MKKYFITFATVATLSVSNAFAAVGTVNFASEILDAACIVDVNPLNQTVDMGKYHQSEFAGVGSRTAAKKFNIVLKDCPTSATAARVRFDGKPDATDPTLLAINNVKGSATGVAINLVTADKVDLPLHGGNG